MANVQHNSLTGADLHEAGPVTVDLDLTDQAADPATPASGHHAAYTKAGGLYVKDDAGVVVGPLIDAASSVSLGTPAVTLGTTNAAGSGSTAVGTGATIAAFDATVPVTQALGDAAAAGTAAVAARRDHKHGMPALSTATPLVESGSGAAGTGTLSSREDHVHPAGGGGSLTVEEADGTPTVTGVTTIKVSNGTLTDDGSGVVSITTGGGGGGASGSAPIQSAVATAAPGTSMTVTLGAAPTNGNVLFCLATGHALTSITQTGVTWTSLLATALGAGDCSLWRGVVGAGASTSVAIAWGGSSTYVAAHVSEWHGITGTVDKSSVSAAAIPDIRTGVIVPTNAAALVLAIIGTTNGTTPFARYVNGQGGIGPFLEFASVTATAALLSIGMAGWCFPGTVPVTMQGFASSGNHISIIASLT